MATHSSILAGRIPWTEEPGRLQTMGSHRVGQTEQLTLSLHFTILLKMIKMVNLMLHVFHHHKNKIT